MKISTQSTIWLIMSIAKKRAKRIVSGGRWTIHSEQQEKKWELMGEFAQVLYWVLIITTTICAYLLKGGITEFRYVGF